MHIHCSGLKILRNLDILKKTMSNYLLTNMYHARFLTLMKNYETWWSPCKYTVIHSHVERKAGCRFNYPKPPSPYTLISHEPEENCQQQIDFTVKILTAVKEVLRNKDLPTDLTLEELFTMAHVTLDDYTKALSISKCGQSVILKDNHVSKM